MIIAVVALFLVIGVSIVVAPHLIKKPQREVSQETDYIDRNIPTTNIGSETDGIYQNDDQDLEESASPEISETTEPKNNDQITEEDTNAIIEKTEDQERIDNPSKSIVQDSPEGIPEYCDEDTVILNSNVPNFNEYDFTHITGDYYSELDSLGRCGVTYAMLEKSLMPTEERGSIGQIKPSGWNQEKYPGIVDSEPPYLYNRCHLIAYSLTGQNANERNLITGTRYFNINSMLGYESAVADCVKYSGYRVLYRVTPYFKEDELLARGVELEAYSLEDKGQEICIHVFIYNIQPGIKINYSYFAA